MPFSKWFQYIKENLFKAHEGFHELPYLSNNPRLIVDSFASLAIATHNKTAQILFSDNTYFRGEQHYFELEEGFWLLASDFNFRKNMVCRAVYDHAIPSDYYFLSFAVFEYQYHVNNEFTEFTSLLSTTCTFYKPGTGVDTFFYENTHGKVFNLGFTRKWLQKFLIFRNKAEASTVENFLDENTGFINWLDIVPDAERLVKELWDYFTAEKDKEAKNTYLGNKVKSIVNNFFTSQLFLKRVVSYPKLMNPDYSIVARAEKLILMHLRTPFLGVETISKSVHVCPTKLKTVFKSVFGFSMLQYHKEKNMLLALQLIKKSDLHIRNIAQLAGYETASKFTAAFKKRFGFLPSDKQQTNTDG